MYISYIIDDEDAFGNWVIRGEQEGGNVSYFVASFSPRFYTYEQVEKECDRLNDSLSRHNIE